MATTHFHKIKSETKENTTYTLMFVYIHPAKDIPEEIICTCPGYKFTGRCKHLEQYDPLSSDLYLEAPYKSFSVSNVS